MNLKKELERFSWLEDPTKDRLCTLLSDFKKLSQENDGGILWNELKKIIFDHPFNQFNTTLDKMNIGIAATLAKLEHYRPQAVYLGSGLIFIPTIWKYPLIGFANDLQISKELLMNGYWELPLTQFMQKHIKPGMHVIDIGANIGYFSVILSFLVGSEGTVDAFEPNPITSSVLKKNLRMNNVLHVVNANETALINTSGTSDFFTFSDNQGGSTLGILPDKLLTLWNEKPNKIQVKTRTLDEVYRKNDSIIDFVKMDAEGSEAKIFEGGKKFFQKNLSPQSYIYLEYNPIALKSAGSDPDVFIDQLEMFEFNLLIEEGNLERIKNPKKIPKDIITDLILKPMDITI